MGSPTLIELRMLCAIDHEDIDAIGRRFEREAELIPDICRIRVAVVIAPEVRSELSVLSHAKA